MILRVARHTHDIEKIQQFYTEVIGLEHLGGFKNHNGYDGVFVGKASLPWHLEFTSSPDIADHKCDEDDILVFYVHSEVEMQAYRNHFSSLKIQIILPRNVYWRENGIMVKDPDGFNTMIAYRDFSLESTDLLTAQAVEKGLTSWNTLVNYIKHLPYGRTSSRTDLSTVLDEAKGTCSSKHALLKQVADNNGMIDVKLILSIYKMSPDNTPEIGHALDAYDLPYIPEAHCYLKINGQKVDVTHSEADASRLTPYVLEEVEITPEQIRDFKIDFHRKFLEQWIKETPVDFTLDELWEIRQSCITNIELNQST